MPTVVSTGLYIGNFAQIDTNENNFTNEGLLPTGNVIDFPTLKLVEISQSDVDVSGTAYSDDRPGLGRTASTFTYNLGNGGVSSILDAEAYYAVRVVLADGSTFTGTFLTYQTQNGDTFLIPSAELDGLDIQSVTLLFRANNDPIWGRNASDSIDSATVICFAAGTKILTKDGEVAVEHLVLGDLVLTRDNGYQPIRWIGSNRLSQEVLLKMPHLRPIRIKAGVLGSGRPSADLLVSPQHRILVSSRVAQRMFGEREVLIGAKHLTILPGVDVDQALGEVEYWHFLLDAHQVVYSNDTPSESLFTGPEALKAVSQEARAEILQLFPDLAEVDHAALPVPARLLIPGRKARQLVLRMMNPGNA